MQNSNHSTQYSHFSTHLSDFIHDIPQVSPPADLFTWTSFPADLFICTIPETISISTKEYLFNRHYRYIHKGIAVLKYPHCKIKFLCSHSCDILFQRIPMVNPLGLNSRQGPTRRMGGGIWYVYQHPTRHNTNISKGTSDCSTPPQLFMMFHKLNKTTPDNIEISQITNWTT